MDIVFFLLPVALLLGLVGLGLMIWALKTGQFEDLEGPAHRILYEDDREMMPEEKSGEVKKKSKEPRVSGGAAKPSGPEG